MIKSVLNKWKQYKYRFVPWIAFNLKDRSVREVPKGADDAIISNKAVANFLQCFFKSLHEKETSPIKDRHTIFKENLDIMMKQLGFVTERQCSLLENGGRGVFVTRGTVPAKTIVSMYPGAVYEQYEPIFFQSLGNSFIFRCIDGVLIDGNDKNLSKLIYKSCQGRDRMGPFLSCDSSWLTESPHNPLAVGQYVNNQSAKYPANVAYQEFDIPSDFPFQLLKYIPNVHYGASTDSITHDRLMRVVVLVSTRDIQCGEELFSTYFTVVQ
ncbi:SET domain-containing protein 9-like [Haliotis rubra]|uniref:SET domain-containing protein 9-like n=1 Tax=Haliotis rubra TaxID=36100 RepID=UPI001EE596FF|nr:SET domain-containing protein 9-like [Haliotis rubra]XP_046561412.1 SET domain-containing protein 9-like [Haliotis rubra]